MEQGIVKNISDKEVDVMWDGLTISFLPGQQRVYTLSMAKAIAGESESLELVSTEPLAPNGSDVPAAPVTESPTAAPATTPTPAPEAKPEWTERKNSKGRIEYRHKGQLISKEAWDAHLAEVSKA
jgi:hypothetical protein